MNTRFINELYKDIDGLIEVREIKKFPKCIFFNTLDELKKYQVPQDKNIYIGVFSRDTNKGTGEHCKTTGALWLDFDGGATLESVKQKLIDNKFPEPSIFINSGHGIHTYWLLNKRENDGVKQILKAMVILMKSDPRVAEIARVMRLPGSMNVKDIIPIKCEIVEATYKRYDIELFKELLNVGEEIACDIEETPKLIKNINIENVKAIELLNADRPCIKNMANGVKEGHRNFAEGRIIKHLQVKGYTKEQTRKIILKWNTNNKPQECNNKLLKDFESYWNGDYKLLGCAINNIELQSILGDYCNRNECKINAIIGNLKLDNTIKYNNRIFKGIDKLTGNDFIVLGVLNRHKEGLTTSKLTEKLTTRATKKCCMNKQTLINCLNTLQKLNMIKVVEGNKRAKEDNFYRAIPQGTFGTGYTVCSNGAINGAIDGRVTPGEFKMYILLLKYAFSKENCYPSLETLADRLRTSTNNITKHLRNLEKHDYIKRNYGYLNNAEKLVMTLLV